ncbi:hypothetical protein AB0A05_29040 [Streptomyces sp. NPDC046374]|uniref:hypothetical protein n=1 Tax=Streptomyces sp. NPDC046374 TaxID=3154917 RepID=UPI0033D85857
MKDGAVCQLKGVLDATIVNIALPHIQDALSSTLILTAVSGLAQHETGATSGLLNATQRVGGSLGLSILVTVFGTACVRGTGQGAPYGSASGS